MASEGDKRLKRNIFIASEVQLLLDCVKLKANVLENKKTNGITIDMKRKAWNEILGTYNAGQTGGTRTLEELRNKYNNEKKAAKHALSINAKESRATGGGSAELVVYDSFDFSSKQVKGLINPVCISDAADNYEERQARSNEESDNDEDADITLFTQLYLDNVNKKKIGDEMNLEKLQLCLKKIEGDWR